MKEFLLAMIKTGGMCNSNLKPACINCAVHDQCSLLLEQFHNNEMSIPEFYSKRTSVAIQVAYGLGYITEEDIFELLL